MEIKLNVGASPIWNKDGWLILDHKASRNSDRYIRGDAAEIDLPDESCSVLFCSHMLEHVPHYKIQRTLLEFSRVLKPGGVLRLLVPDLERIAKAYVEKDEAFFDKALEEDKNIRQDLGIGGKFMNFVISPGQDTVLVDRGLSEFVGGYAHLYAYDFGMMKILLDGCGFSDVRKVGFCESSVAEFSEPMHVTGLPPVWRAFNDQFFKDNKLTHVYENGRYNINFTITGFDKNPITSLIIEARKSKTVRLSSENDMNGQSASNYNRYGGSLLFDTEFKSELEKRGIQPGIWGK